MRALLVVDVDYEDGWRHNINDLPDDDMKKVGRAIKKELANWRLKQEPIIFIMLVGDIRRRQRFQITADKNKEQLCIACSMRGNRIARFLKHGHGKQFEPVFLKDSDNAFTNSDLISFLRSQDVSEIVLVGCNTFACVLSTAEGAVKNGIGVTLLKDCAYPPFFGAVSEFSWKYHVNKHNSSNVRVEII